MGISFLSIAGAAISARAKLGIELQTTIDPEHPMVKLLHGDTGLRPVEGEFILAQSLLEPQGVARGTQGQDLPDDQDFPANQVVWNILMRPVSSFSDRRQITKVVCATGNGVFFHGTFEQPISDFQAPINSTFIKALWYMEIWKNRPLFFGNERGSSELDLALRSDPLAVEKKAVGLLEDGLKTQLNAVYYDSAGAHAAVILFNNKAVVLRSVAHPSPCARLTRIASVAFYGEIRDVGNPVLPGTGLSPDVVCGPFVTWNSLEKRSASLFWSNY